MPDSTGDTSPAPSSSSKSSFGFLTKRIGPVPVWLIIVAVVAAWYWYYHYGPGAQAAQQAQQPQSGQTINVRIVDSDSRRTGTNPGGPIQPPEDNDTKTVTVPRDMTLAQFAASRHWESDTTAAVMRLNNLTLTSQLHAGQTLKRPLGEGESGESGNQEKTTRWRAS